MIAEMISPRKHRTHSAFLPPLYLHIGRGKSGSTTIQSLAHQHLDFMEARGFDCPKTVHGMVNHGRLAAALVAPRQDPETIRMFRRSARRNQKKLFISAERLLLLPREGMQRLKRSIGGREVRVVCYVRDYPSWIQSIYAQRTKKAWNLKDFDAYFAAVRNDVSALPHIELWAEFFGWEVMHVRPLLPEALVEGDLIADLLSFLEIDARPDGMESLNMSPHWVTLEVMRAWAAAAAAASLEGLKPKFVKLVRPVVESCAAGVLPRRAQYLTQEQWLDLAELYRSDMSVVSHHMGISFPISLPEPPERSLLPDISAVPTATKADILTKLDTPYIRARLPSAFHELLMDLLATTPAQYSHSSS